MESRAIFKEAFEASFYEGQYGLNGCQGSLYMGKGGLYGGYGRFMKVTVVFMGVGWSL